MSLRLIASARPRVHHDALDWARRVAANGGSVSQSTLRSVSAFCDAIDRAAIRDRFYRLNLFCGTGLTACLVPLYRGQSLGGTQFGNTTDTNANFVSGDYVETGSTGGLKGGSTKSLDTGLLATTLPDDRHLAAYVAVAHSGFSTTWVGVDNFSDSGFYISHLGVITSTIVRQRAIGGDFNGTAGTNANASLVIGNAKASGGSATMYVNGSLNASASTGSRTLTGLAHYVFAANRKNTAVDNSLATLGGYSLGAAMGATQAAAYDTAIRAFQKALGRNA